MQDKNKEDQNKKKKQGETGNMTERVGGDEKDFKEAGIEGAKGADDPELKEENEGLKAENERLTVESEENNKERNLCVKEIRDLKDKNAKLEDRNSELLKKDHKEEVEDTEKTEEKAYVTGEDVVKNLRQDGKNI